MIEISRTFRFEAAHYLPAVPEGHKCRRLHGHSYRFTVTCRGEIDPQTGWLMDFADISAVVKPIVKKHLDHYFLNEVEGLSNPTSEELARWLWRNIKPHLPQLFTIKVGETCTSSCTYRG